jgi:hypothetical protein
LRLRNEAANLLQNRPFWKFGSPNIAPLPQLAQRIVMLMPKI